MSKGSSGLADRYPVRLRRGYFIFSWFPRSAREILFDAPRRSVAVPRDPAERRSRVPTVPWGTINLSGFQGRGLQCPRRPQGHPLVGRFLGAKIHPGLAGVIELERPASAAVSLILNGGDGICQAWILAEPEGGESLDDMQQVGDVKKRASQSSTSCGWACRPSRSDNRPWPGQRQGRRQPPAGWHA